MAHTSSSALARIDLHTPADLLAVVPYLLGFHPADSLVLVGFEGSRLLFTMRGDLPREDRADACRGLARCLIDITGEHRVDGIVVVAYGSGSHVDPVIPTLLTAIESSGFVVREALRVTDRRYRSWFCRDSWCCPPEGVPFDQHESPVAAAATVAGRVALPDRSSLERQIEPVTGAAREAMTHATDLAEKRLCERLESGDLRAARRRLVREGVRRLGVAERRRKRALTDDQVAWLSLLLLFPEVSEVALRRVTGRADPSEMAADLALWADVTRRAEPELSAPAATLVAYAAWRGGDGALAGIAAHRAMNVAPEYAPARIIAAAVATGVEPGRLSPG